MEDMEKRGLLAILLCLLILFFWQSTFFKKRGPLVPENPEPLKQETSQPVQKESEERKVLKSFPTEEEKEVLVDTDLYKALFSSHGGSLKSWKLKKYKNSIKDGELVEMVSQKNPEFYPLSVHMTLPGYENRREFEYQIEVLNPHHLLFVYEDPKIKIEREYKFQSQSYQFAHATRIWLRNNRNEIPRSDVFIGLSEGFPEIEKKNILLAPYSDVRNFVFHLQEKTERIQIANLKEETSIKEIVTWSGIENRYFVSALINQSTLKPYAFLSKPLPGTGAIDLQYPFYREAGKNYFELKVTGYIGPKVVEYLKAVEPSLEKAVDFGIFSVLCVPLLKTMNFFYAYCHNYGIAILLLTLLIRILFHPLTKKSLKSMREMQRVQPQIAKIKEKFKDDRQQMNKEIMELMRANKVNPLGGCLPLLFQMPIFFALYRLLYNAIELYQAPFFGWIQDLSAKDPWFITPVLMGIAMFFQQKMTPSATMDPAQRKMMMVMPIIFSFFMIALPSGLVIYILFSTILQVISQVLVNKDFSKKEA